MTETIQRLLQYSQATNLCDYIDEDVLRKLGRRVCKDAQTDDDSRDAWKARSERAMDMALQVVEDKESPWPKASNVKSPLLTEAALQFHGRAYPAVIQGDKIVKGKVTGADPQGQKLGRADRISQHMNYQLTEEMPEWEEEMDKLLLALPVEGVEFKKVYFDPILGRNVSEWIRPKNLIINDKTKSLATCPRATHCITKYPHQIAELQRAGTYREVDLRISSEDDETEALQDIYEQHRLEDFDGDGVKEPYIVTVHKESQEVLRVKSNWEPTGIYLSDGVQSFSAFNREGTQVFPNPQLPTAQKLVCIKGEQYFVKFSMFPSPDGSFYDVGYGQLVTPLIDAIDSTLNQIIDAGTLANAPPGLIAEGMKLVNAAGSGEVRFKPGEWKKVKAGSAAKIADMIYQFQFPGPSPVLFNVLSALIEQVKSITSISDAMTGESAGANEPMGTTLARIEQGMKVFNGVYKRIYRALGQEFRLLYRLNSIYLQPEQYFTVVDSPEPIQIQIMDYQGDDTDIQPISDPSVATTMQRMGKMQFLASVPVPNEMAKLKRILDAAEIEGVDELMTAPPPQPDPKAQEIMAKIEKMAAETQKIAMDTQKSQAEIAEMFQRIDLDKFKAVADVLNKEQEHGLRAESERNRAVEARSGDKVVSQEDETDGAGVIDPAMFGSGEPTPYSGATGLE